MSRARNGFTLVEILVVAGIIALLAGIALPNLLRARVEANQATAQATLKTISSALETYMAANGTYPVSTTALISAVPAYLNKDYFSGAPQGYAYTATLGPYLYSVVATPSSGSMGTKTYTMTTGGVLTSSP